MALNLLLFIRLERATIFSRTLLTVILKPDSQREWNSDKPPVDKISGAFGRVALGATAAELLIYWLLVIRFPLVMAVVSLALCTAAWLFRRAENYLESLREELQLSARDMDRLDRYCKYWIYIAAYGTAFCLFLLLKG